jgi:hypothetical protein
MLYELLLTRAVVFYSWVWSNDHPRKQNDLHTHYKGSISTFNNEIALVEAL